jgi:hypothetical protein
MRTRGAERGAQISDDETEAEWAECPQCEHEGWMGTYCPQCEDQGMIHSFRVWSCESLEENRRQMDKSIGSWIAAIDSKSKGGERATSGRPGMFDPARC